MPSEKNTRQEKHVINTPFLPFILHDETLVTKKMYTHWHENIEILHCVEGSGTVQLDAKAIEINEGQTVIVNSKCLHTIGSDEKIRYICLIVDNEFFKSNGIKVNSLIFNEKIADEKADKLIKDICDAYGRETDMFGKAEIRLSILSYILYLCKTYSKERKNEPTHNTKSYLAVLDAVEYININFPLNIKVEELAEMFNYSKYHFARMFKENTGFTIVEHINKRRCEHARLLLRDSKRPISQICYECGFDTPSYFTKAFKELYGKLPSDYRKEYCTK